MRQNWMLVAVMAVVGSSAAWAVGPGQSTAANLNRQLRERQSLRSQRQTSPVQQWLDQNIESVSFDETPFEDVIRWLRELPGEMNIVMDWPAIDGLGVDREAPVTLELKNVPLYKILDFVLKEAGADVPLGYQGTDNILRITVVEELNQPSNFVIRVYPVTDLIRKIVNFTRSPSIRLSNLQERQSGGGGGGSSLFSDDDDDDEDEEVEERVKIVIDMVVTTIEPESWTQNGGFGTITAINDVVIINNSISVHEKIGGAIRQQRNPAR